MTFSFLGYWISDLNTIYFKLVTTLKFSAQNKKKVTKKVTKKSDLFPEFSNLNKKVTKFSDLFKLVAKFVIKIKSQKYLGHHNFILVTKLSNLGPKLVTWSLLSIYHYLPNIKVSQQPPITHH